LTYIEFWTNSAAQKTAELIPLKSGQTAENFCRTGESNAGSDLRRPAGVCRRDLAHIEEQLRAIRGQIARLPTRADLARAALGIIFGTAGLVIGWFELVWRQCF
jgi:hypothetical protein